MATSGKKVEATRPVAAPYDDNEGNLRAFVPLSPKGNTTRAALPVPPRKVVPVIVIAGIMGSNLRAKKISNGTGTTAIRPGEAAWRPPNAMEEGLSEAKIWLTRTPANRQRILDPDTLEVDPEGVIMKGIPSPNFVWDEKIQRERGWGEIHASSYGHILVDLQETLNTTFRSAWGNPILEDRWSHLNLHDRRSWGVKDEDIGKKITDEEFKKFADFQYPVYAFGYNWLKSNELAAELLKIRIESIISDWKSKKRQCDAVLLVTHSMGGLVGRACAKKIPEKIAGIVHGVMPALGAPACYRRLACGTERSSPSNGVAGNIAAEKFSDIAGPTIAETTAVMATTAGPLELLPTNLYPKPWLFFEVRSNQNLKAPVVFKEGDPYAFYLDFTPWYRVIEPSLADPANRFNGKAIDRIKEAIAQAKKFHLEVLGDYYHPKTFVFYGDDPKQLSFGSFRWVSVSNFRNLSEQDVQNAKFITYRNDGTRVVKCSNGEILEFKPAAQDAYGDGTVPSRSGSGPENSVIHIFRTKGFSHQGSYSDSNMRALTRHLIVKLVQKI